MSRPPARRLRPRLKGLQPRPWLRRDERGFTLVEAMIAIVVLIFGLLAVSNLMVVAASSNHTASASTAATTEAATTMEALKSISFERLVEGGGLDAEPGCRLDCAANPGACPGACVQPGVFGYVKNVPGVCNVDTRWSIEAMPGDKQTLFVTVVSECQGAMLGNRTRAMLTTFRSCTSATTGCPAP